MGLADTAFRAASSGLIAITVVGTVYFGANIYKGYSFLSDKKQQEAAARGTTGQ